MKCVRVGLLAVAILFAGCLSAQDKVKSVGYDIGSCAPGSFVGAHVELGPDFVITEVAPGPDRVVKLETPIVYKFVKEDKEGKHYSGGKLELIITQADKDGIVGKLVKDNGDIAVVVYGVPADGDKLAENAKDFFGVCKALVEDDEDPKRSKS